MRVLITNLQFSGRSGTELYAFELALALMRQGHMPTWDERMTDAEIRTLSLYVHDLGTGQP